MIQVNHRTSVRARYERIDRIALLSFPIIFFIFNICYWSYYLLFNDLIKDLW